jgi:hypothetical protein
MPQALSLASQGAPIHPAQSGNLMKPSDAFLVPGKATTSAQPSCLVSYSNGNMAVPGL